MMSRSPTPAARSLRRLAAPLLALTALLGGCGGGGGDSATSEATYNLDAAISRALQAGVAFTGLTGSLSGVSFTLAMSYTPQADATFEGALRRVVRETVTITGGGQSQTTVARQFFSTGPYVAQGAIDDDGTYTVLTSAGNLPTAARVGDSGPLHTGTEYVDATKSTVTGTTRMTWSLDADTATTALACLRSVETSTGDPQPITGAQCLRINTAGEVLGAVVTVSQGSTSITFR